jgi:hypothetical protein
MLGSLDFANTLGTLRVGNAWLGTTSGASCSGTLAITGSAQVAGPLHTRAGSACSLAPGGVLTMGGPTWTNDGLASVSAPGASAPSYLRPAGHALLAGAGTLRLHHADLAVVDSPAGWEFTQAATHTIAGEGVVTAPLHNLGSVVADATGRTLSLHAIRTNAGALRATAGARLWILNSSITNTGGQVVADGGSVEFTSSHLSGGITGSTGSSAVDLTGGNAMSDASNLGLLRVRPGANLTLLGSTLTNSGTLQIGETASGTAAYVRPGAHVTIQGPGRVRLEDSGLSVFDSPGGWTVTQAADHTIQGTGILTTPLVNHGTVSANVTGGALALTGAMTNDGIMRAENGGLLSMTGVVLSNAGGHVLAAGGDVELVHTSVAGGTLSAGASNTLHYRGGVTTSDATLVGTHRVHAGANVTWTGATTTNEGVFAIGEPGRAALAYLRPGAHVTLGGNGTLELVDESYSVLDSPGGWGLTHAAGHTIRGAGVLTCPLANHGLVSADVNGRRLYVSTSLTNHGTLRAANGGQLQLQSCGVANEGGYLGADGGRVDLSNSTVHGGTIGGAVGSVVHLRDYVALWDLTQTAEMHLHGASQLVLLGGGIRNDGTLVISPPGESQTAWCRPGAHVTITGTGRIVLNRHSLAAFDSPGGWTVTQADSHSIRGTGWIVTPLLNRGTIRADRDSGALEVAGPNEHTGACEAAYGAVLRFTALPANLAGGVLTGGTWTAYANSAIRFVGASVTTNAATIVLDGERSRLESDDNGHSALAALSRNAPAGTFAVRNGRSFLTTVPFTNQGTLIVGDKCRFTIESPGLADAGATDFEQSAGGSLVVEIAGRPAARHGAVEVCGRARLDGTLRVAMLDGFVPAPGDSFVVMTFDERDGSFTTWLDLQVAPGVWLSPVWEARRLVLVARTAPGVEAPPPAPPASLGFAPVGPFSMRALQLALPADSRVRVELFDSAGRRIATLADGALAAGVHRWPVPPGAGLWLARATVHDATGVQVRRAKVVVWR